MVKVSVIVPVYNMEKYLGICLSSLVHQTFKDFEIIVINDGSKDRSEDIIKDYQKQYPNLLKYYSFPNQGISKSRNYGLKVAKGKYVTFIDSDDYVDIHFLEKMYERITTSKADICVCDYYTVSEDDEIKEFRIDSFEDGCFKNNPQLLLKINSSPWNKLFKKTLFKDLCFEDIKYEDLLLIPKVICLSTKIVKLDSCLNYYRIRAKSETTIVDEKVFDILKILEKLNDFFRREGILDKYYSEIEYFNIYRVTIYTIQQRYQTDRDVRERFIDAAFNFLDDNFPKWRKNIYYKKKNILKRIIERNRLFTKIYVNMYRR